MYSWPCMEGHFSTPISSAPSERGTGGAWRHKRGRFLQASVLNRTFRRPEQGELVERDSEPGFPYHATYQLTPQHVNWSSQRCHSSIGPKLIRIYWIVSGTVGATRAAQTTDCLLTAGVCAATQLAVRPRERLSAGP